MVMPRVCLTASQREAAKKADQTKALADGLMVHKALTRSTFQDSLICGGCLFCLWYQKSGCTVKRSVISVYGGGPCLGCLPLLEFSRASLVGNNGGFELVQRLPLVVCPPVHSRQIGGGICGHMLDGSIHGAFPVCPVCITPPAVIFVALVDVLDIIKIDPAAAHCLTGGGGANLPMLADDLDLFRGPQDFLVCHGGMPPQ